MDLELSISTFVSMVPTILTQLVLFAAAFGALRATVRSMKDDISGTKKDIAYVRGRVDDMVHYAFNQTHSAANTQRPNASPGAQTPAPIPEFYGAPHFSRRRRHRFHYVRQDEADQPPAGSDH